VLRQPQVDWRAIAQATSHVHGHLGSKTACELPTAACTQQASTQCFACPSAYRSHNINIWHYSSQWSTKHTAMPSEEDRATATGNMHKKIWWSSAALFWVMWADRRTHRQTDWCTNRLIMILCNPNGAKEQPFYGSGPGLAGWASTRINMHPLWISDYQPCFISFLYLLHHVIHCILPLQFTCLTVFFTASLKFSLSGIHFVLHTFFHPIIVFFLQHMPIPSQTVVL